MINLVMLINFKHSAWSFLLNLLLPSVIFMARLTKKIISISEGNIKKSYLYMIVATESRYSRKEPILDYFWKTTKNCEPFS